MASPLPGSAARMHDAFGVGTDLWHLDTATGHYTQAANGLTDLRLYNSPVGIPDQVGWRFRDPRLGAPAADGTVAPVEVPVAVHLAPRLGGPTFATMSNEDHAPMGIGLASIAGAAPAAAMGRESGDMIAYPAPIASSPSDIAVRATASGIAVRLVLHSTAEHGPFVFSLVLDQIERLAQETGGAIKVTRPMTTYGDDGVPHVIQQTEYVIYAPRVADRNAPAGVGSTGPAARSSGFTVVVALSAHDVWVLGPAGSSLLNPAETLAAHWDGTRWRMAPFPSVGSPSAAAGLSAAHIWVVSVPPNPGLPQPPTGTLVTHWDGRQWCAS